MTRRAAVAAGDRNTVEAAVTVLRAGGNAIDGAVAAGFAAAVAEPCLTSLAGGGFLMHRDAAGRGTLYDFFVDAPGRGRPTQSGPPHFEPITLQFAGTTQTFHCGYGSVAMPGVLSGYLTAHDSGGRLPLADVVAPAISLARNGFTLSQAQADILRLLDRILLLTPEAAATFGPYLEASSTSSVTNRAYADFLDELVAHRGIGTDPSWRTPLLTAMAEHDGLLTREDLDAYEVAVRDPMTIDLDDATVLTNPPPAFGGSIVGAALRTLYTSRRIVERPDAVELLGALRAATIEGKNTVAARSTHGTTHVSVIDADGAVVSMTTSNGSCSGVMVPGTGIQLNNMMGESDLHPEGFHSTAPGTRIASMMAPSIITTADGGMVALGSGGSERIRSAIVQVAIACLSGVDARSAVEAPRLHLDDDDVVQAEPGVPADVLDLLRQRWDVNEWPRRDLYFGGAQVVRRTPDGELQAAGDPRRGGASAVVDL